MTLDIDIGHLGTVRFCQLLTVGDGTFCQLFLDIGRRYSYCCASIFFVLETFLSDQVVTGLDCVAAIPSLQFQQCAIERFFS